MKKRPAHQEGREHYNTTAIRWQSQTTHVDEETGEILTKTQTKNGNYIKTSTRKETSRRGTTGIIRWVLTYRRNPQLTIGYRTNEHGTNRPKTNEE